MMLRVYSVFDAKLASFGRPWYEMTDASAIRVFSDAVNDGSNPANQWHKHPEDFSLFYLGDFTDDDGGIRPQVPPVSLVSASAIYVAPGLSSHAEFDLNFNEKYGRRGKEPASID